MGRPAYSYWSNLEAEFCANRGLVVTKKPSQIWGLRNGRKKNIKYIGGVLTEREDCVTEIRTHIGIATETLQRLIKIINMKI